MAFGDALGGILDLLSGLGAGANYMERLKPLVIVTADRKRYDLIFEDLDTAKENKTSEYTFSEKPGAFVQNFGLGVSRYPITCFIAGLQYDKEADSLEKSLGLKGDITLHHPRYGKKNVVVTGWKREDREKSGAGQAVFTIDMTESIDISIPGIRGKAADFFSKLTDFIDAAVTAFSLVKSTIDTIAEDVATIRSIVDGVAVAFESIIGSVDELRDRFDFLKKTILESTTFGIDDPEDLGSALIELILLPSSAVSAVETAEVVRAYETSFDTIVSTAPSIASDTDSYVTVSSLVALCGGACVMGMSEAAISGDYFNSAEAIDALTRLFELFASLQAQLDEIASRGENNDISRLYNIDSEYNNSLKEALATSIRILLDIAYNSRKEVITVLSRDYTIIDLCFELYGTSANDQRRLLIDSNMLSGTELVILPTGKEVKYYV